MMNSPFKRPTLTSETGPLKGMSETANADAAAKHPNVSGLMFSS